MIQLKQALRLVFRNWKTSVLVLISLTAGLSTYVIINAGVAYHRSFDRHFENSGKIYRIVSSTYKDGNLSISQPRTQRIMGETLRQTYPLVKEAGFLCQAMSTHYSHGEHFIVNERAFHCSEGFLKIFSPVIVQGKTSALLSRPNMVIISESFARRYFGDQNPVGESILQYPALHLEVEAVYRDFPPNTHFQPEILISFHDDMHLPPPVKNHWGEFSFTTYLELEEGAELPALEKAIGDLFEENNQKLLLNSASEYSFHLQAITSIHTRSQLKNEIGINVRSDYLGILQWVSVFILIISAFNYVYFTYIRISKNSRHYGMKRVLGAQNQSFLLFLTLESLLFHLVALMVSVLIGYQFNSITQGGGFWLGLISTVTLSSLIIPVILLRLFTRRSTIQLLQGDDHSSRDVFSFRKLFTIAQFAIIIFLVSVILGMGRQVNYLESRDKGMDIRNKLVIRTPTNMRRTSQRVNNLRAFETDLAALAGIQRVSIGSSTPGDTPAFSFNASEHPDDMGIKTALFIADSSYLETFDIDLIAGRASSGSAACLVNETCLFQLGYESVDDILGTSLFLNDDSGLQRMECKVSGVCKDFNFTNAKDLPDPIVIMDWTAEIMWGKYILSVEANSDHFLLLSRIEELFHRTFPNYSFEYYWVEESYNSQFQEENTILLTLKRFGIITILMGILSLLSMVRHSAQARTRELGIRRINGATQVDILYLLNKHFLSWIAQALFIGLSLSWIFLNQWLDSFAYKQPITWWTFLLSGGGALLLGCLTVSLQSIQAVARNPVDSIKIE